jgi:hypothetical protein
LSQKIKMENQNNLQGVEQIKHLIDLVCTGIERGKAIAADKRISIFTAIDAVGLVLGLIRVSWKALKVEIKDLNEVEIKDLVQYVMSKGYKFRVSTTVINYLRNRERPKLLKVAQILLGKGGSEVIEIQH